MEKDAIYYLGENKKYRIERIPFEHSKIYLNDTNTLIDIGYHVKMYDLNTILYKNSNNELVRYNDDVKIILTDDVFTFDITSDNNIKIIKHSSGIIPEYKHVNISGDEIFDYIL